jgi:hypothetical protein
MIDLQKVAEDSFIDELNKIAMSEGLLTGAIEAASNRAIAAKGGSITKDWKRSIDFRRGLTNRRMKYAKGEYTFASKSKE